MGTRNLADRTDDLLATSAPLFSRLVPVHRLLLRPLPLQRVKHLVHAILVHPIFLHLLLVLHSRKELGILAQLANSPLALLLELIPQLGRLVALAIRVLSPDIR